MRWLRTLQSFLTAKGVELFSVDTHGERLHAADFSVLEERRIEWYFDSDRPEMRGKEWISKIMLLQLQEVIDNMTPKIFCKDATELTQDNENLAQQAKHD